MNEEIKKIYVPARFADAKWSDVPANIQELVVKMKESRKGLLLSGDVGSGKTHIAYAIARYVGEELLHLVSVWNSAELMQEIRRYINDGSYDVATELKKYRGLLIIDDIGAEKLTEWVEEQLYLIINKRYEEMLPTIFTSNFSIEQQAERMSDRIVSRIAGMCELVTLEGKDRRVHQ